MRCAIYVRASTARGKRSRDEGTLDTDSAAQEKLLCDLIARRGWTFYRRYEDCVSSMKEGRPGYAALMAGARDRNFDVVVVWRFDRFSRSARQFVLALEALSNRGIRFVSCHEEFDTSTRRGRDALATVIALADLEHWTHRERALASLEHAEQHGTRSGRPIGRPTVALSREQVNQLRADGHSLRVIASRLGVGVGTVRRVLQDCRVGEDLCQNPKAGTL